MEYLEIRQQIIEACLWLQEKELVIGTWGNVSVRLDEMRIMMTPSKMDYNIMKPEDLVIVGMDGNRLEGTHSATSEMDVHRLIYAQRKDVGAVVHCHSVYASAMCASGRGIPPILEEMSQMIGGEIPITKAYINAGSHVPLGLAATKTLQDKNAVLLRNHGPVSVGRDLKEALICCQVVEKAAKCYLALCAGQTPELIPDNMVQSERKRFLYQYGHEH
ncbi:MAG: class aldolase/adducin family protein [Caproiciproducens sp.]|jgi:L-fuculose-phosphate aldolase|nr:class aldolase/adducin family protein [Caproiciproducens sp.]